MCDVFPRGLQWFILPFLLAVITLASKAEGCGIPNLTQEEAVLSVCISTFPETNDLFDLLIKVTYQSLWDGSLGSGTAWKLSLNPGTHKNQQVVL